MGYRLGRPTASSTSARCSSDSARHSELRFRTLLAEDGTSLLELLRAQNLPTADRGPTTSSQTRGSVEDDLTVDRKSTRLNSSHANISYAVFCLKKKK